ncbi:MAG: hypothetical protein ABIQ12_05350 [Opitutaceae bacterium]
MDDDLKQLEVELQRLRPAAPSRALRLRVERELAAPALQVASRPVAPVRWVWFAALPAAAAVAVMLVQYSRRNPVPRPMNGSQIATPPVVASADAALKPVTTENVLVSASDEGLVTLDDGTLARRERLQFVDTITWKNPRTNSSLRWSIPREEVRVMPVVFQ